MALSEKDKDFLIWSFQAIAVLTVIVCAVIRISLIASPPIYTLTDLVMPTTQGGSGLSVQERDEVTQTDTSTTAVFSLVITNPNNKGILYDESKLTLSQNGLFLGKSSLSPFYQKGKSSLSNPVLLNADRFISGENGTLKIGLETAIRYRILRWSTKRHLLNLQTSVPVGQNGMFSIGEEGAKLKPVKR